ncbi:hypothetical protein ISN45_Aa04g031210 [Arabidopsis thaliana x Arabidopsis arenosa]|nr:hypothetical protein ISN45_Aa04g031210 [Arabidopsis thaliana x Arabidopsis arenosa]
MFSFLYSAGNKIAETFEEFGYFERDEVSNIKAKNIQGLELQLTSENLQEYDYNSIKSTCFNEEIGILYKLKYGEIGARLMYKTRPMAQFTGTLRLLGYLSGLELNSMSIVDINSQKLDKWYLGLTIIAGNASVQIRGDADKYVVSTRHRIHPRFVSLTEMNKPFLMRASLEETVAMGFEFELNPRTTLEVMVSHYQAPAFALQYQCSRDQCLIRVYSDVYSKKTGLSFAFLPSSS